MHINTKLPRWNRYRVNVVFFFFFALSFNFFSIIYRWRKIHYENMTFPSNCCVRYNPKDSLVILIRNNALTKYGQPWSCQKPHKYKPCSTCQNVAQILIQYLAQDYSFTLPRILKAVCVHLLMLKRRGKCSQDVARQEAFPGGWPDIVANICNFLLKMSQGSASSKTEEKGGDGEKRKDFIYVETNY